MCPLSNLELAIWPYTSIKLCVEPQKLGIYNFNVHCFSEDKSDACTRTATSVDQDCRFVNGPKRAASNGAVSCATWKVQTKIDQETHGWTRLVLRSKFGLAGASLSLQCPPRSLAHTALMSCYNFLMSADMDAH